LRARTTPEAYRPRASPALQGFAYRAVHAFSDRDFGNSLRIPARADVIVVLQWNDQFGGAADDFDLVLARRAPGGDVVLAAATDRQAGSGNPYEALRFANVTSSIDAYIAIAERTRVRPPSELRFDLHVFSRAPIGPRAHGRSATASSGMPPSKRCCRWRPRRRARPDRLEPFSAHGPASILLSVPVARQVPRLTAVDGIETAVGRRVLCS
jgi:hypothetical protein